jgi:phage shock protein PspC (stress-responsive transcriptional regulator)
MLGGVAAGAADYLGVDPLAVRIGLVFFAIFGGLSIPLYAAAWLLVPEEESESSIAEHLFHHDARL